MGVAYVDRRQERLQNAKRHHAHLQGTRWWHFAEHVTEWYMSRQKYVHCEIAFPDNDPRSDTCVAYAVFVDKGVVKMDRTFSNPAYHWIYLSITDEQYQTAMRFCEGQLGKPYDYNAAGWRLALWPPAAGGNSWWCASLVHAVLQKVGLLVHHQINTLDVDDVVETVKRSRRVIKVGMSPAELSTALVASEADLFGVPLTAGGRASDHGISSHPLRCQ